MSLELRVSGGALDGQRAQFDQDSILVGRDAHADVRLDPIADRDVSARHAEIRRRAGRWVLRDLNSTNGTFLNGTRLVGEAPLREGDRIGCGAAGPVLHVHLIGEAAAGAADDGRTLQRAAAAVPSPDASGAPAHAARHTPHTRAPRWRLVVAGLAGLALIGAVATYVVAQRRTAERLAEVDAMLRRADSIRVAAERNAAVLTGQLAGLDSALASERQRTGQLLGTLRDAQSARRPAGREVARELEDAAQRQARLATLAAFDYTSVNAANQRAVAILAVEMSDGSASSGTAFGVSPRGLLVTNRHVVTGAGGEAPRRVIVKYSGTDRWLEARVVRRDDASDLATLQVEDAGSYPAVKGLAASAAAVSPGSPVALIGYPLGTDTPMDRAGAGRDFTARTTLTAGMVSKTVDGVVQIDAYAAHGSSGSPVFDRRGAVVGVVYGGPREGNGRIVYAVAVDRLHALLPESTIQRIR